MSKFRRIARAATMSAVALLVGVSLSAAQEAWQSPTPALKHSAATQKWSTHGTKFANPSATAQIWNQSAFAGIAPAAARNQERSLPSAPKHSVAAQKRSTHGTKPTKPSATARRRNQSAFARLAPPAANSHEHRLILQVNNNDPAAMNLTLNNAMNVTQYYRELGEKVKIEVITFGSGLHMLRDDTSPVKARIETMALSTPEVSFKACGNTQENMHKAENKEIPIIPQAQVVKSGVVRVIELQEQGWTYVKP